MKDGKGGEIKGERGVEGERSGESGVVVGYCRRKFRAVFVLSEGRKRGK